MGAIFSFMRKRKAKAEEKTALAAASADQAPAAQANAIDAKAINSASGYAKRKAFASHHEALEHQKELRHLSKLTRNPRVVAKLLAEPEQPVPGFKYLFLFRHGEGEHNAFVAKYNEEHPDAESKIAAYSLPECPIDPPLTAKGLEEVDSLSENFDRRFIPYPELLVVSPLTRTIQTALKAFDGKKVNKILANDLCREKTGQNRCDIRSSRSELEAKFPQVDFSGVANEKDETEGTPRESTAALAERAYRFMLWIRDREETSIAVATHSVFLLTLCSNIFDDLEPDPDVPLGKWFETGEMRIFKVRFEPLQ